MKRRIWVERLQVKLWYARWNVARRMIHLGLRIAPEGSPKRLLLDHVNAFANEVYATIERGQAVSASPEAYEDFPDIPNTPEQQAYQKAHHDKHVAGRKWVVVEEATPKD